MYFKNFLKRKNNWVKGLLLLMGLYASTMQAQPVYPEDTLALTVGAQVGVGGFYVPDPFDLKSFARQNAHTNLSIGFILPTQTGVELNYSLFGDRYDAGGQALTFDVKGPRRYKARAVYMMAIYRISLTRHMSITGKAGIAYVCQSLYHKFLISDLEPLIDRKIKQFQPAFALEFSFYINRFAALTVGLTHFRETGESFEMNRALAGLRLFLYPP